MTTVDAATSSIEDAGESLYEATQSRERKKYHRAVRRSQEAVELSLKALCWFYALVPPKSHDIGFFVLRELGNRIDPSILRKMATLSRNLEKSVQETRPDPGHTTAPALQVVAKNKWIPYNEL